MAISLPTSHDKPLYQLQTDQQVSAMLCPVQIIYLAVTEMEPRTWCVLNKSLPLNYTPAFVVLSENCWLQPVTGAETIGTKWIMWPQQTPFELACCKSFVKMEAAHPNMLRERTAMSFRVTLSHRRPIVHYRSAVLAVKSSWGCWLNAAVKPYSRKSPKPATGYLQVTHTRFWLLRQGCETEDPVFLVPSVSLAWSSLSCLILVLGPASIPQS